MKAASGMYGLSCFNALSQEQQRLVVEEGVLPFGRWEPEGGTCERGAEVEVTTVFDKFPGARFYCTSCAITYLVAVRRAQLEPSEA